ncbi:NAD(P)H-dependent oxidoreductase [Rhodococcus sp. T2V]|nr:NAD(P)H-dependent oxidoreductase [Rhodococcus sp. T2V]
MHTELLTWEYRMRICVLVGNPKAGSRTLAAAEALAARLTVPSDTIDVIDLAEHVGEIFTWPSEKMDSLTAQVAGSEILIVASPTYKASYTGLLKSFLDRYSASGLRGVYAIPVMTGADRGHAMAPDVNLRPLLAELGASAPTESLYIETPKIDSLDELLSDWIRLNTPLLPIDAGADIDVVTAR